MHPVAPGASEDGAARPTEARLGARSGGGGTVTPVNGVEADLLIHRRGIRWRRVSHKDLVPFAGAVASLLAAYPNGWSGTSAELLASLEQYRPADRADIWPPNAQSLSRHIAEVLPSEWRIERRRLPKSGERRLSLTRWTADARQKHARRHLGSLDAPVRAQAEAALRERGHGDLI